MSLGRRLGSPFRKAVQVARFHSLQTEKDHVRTPVQGDTVARRIKERSVAKRRKQLMNELFETEKTYQHHLSLLITLFLHPLREKNLLPPKALESIFSNIEGIQKINSKLLDFMETSGVAKAFQEMTPYLKLYTLYANNYENAIKVMEENEKKSMKFLKFKEDQESRPEMKGLKLLALLITPVQRVPRYKLLLESILQQTYETNEEYNVLKGASEEINRLAVHINECIRQHENFQKMLSIQNNLIGEGVPRILIPGRLFLREGTLLKVCKRGGSQERVLLLFNDILVCAKRETSGLFNCRHVLSLDDCVIEQLLGGNNPSGGILFKVISKTASLLFYSESQADAVSWMHDMKSAIAELHANLASLRRSQEADAVIALTRDLNVKRGTRIRRSRVIVEKKNLNRLTPLKRAICPSPISCKDSLYPMRKTEQTKPFAEPKINSAVPSTESVASRCFKTVTGRKSSAYRKRKNMTENKPTSVDNGDLNEQDAATESTALGQQRTSDLSLPKSTSCFSSMESLRYQNTKFSFGGEDVANLDPGDVFLPDKDNNNIAPSHKRLKTGKENRSGTSLFARSIKKARRSRKSKSASEIGNAPDFTSWYYNNGCI